MKKLLFFILIISFVASCKSDVKNEEDFNSDLSVDTKVLNERSRSQDSLDIVKKLRSNNQPVDGKEVSEMLKKVEIDRKNPALPAACELLNAEEVNNVFDVGEFNIMESNGKRREEGNGNSTSCFWRWKGGGVMVQVSKNPLPEEVDDWCTRYINTKKSSGENSQQGKFMYKDFDGPGTMNIFNRELGRFYSTLEEKYIVTMIFNENMSAKKQLKAAQKLMGQVFKKI